MQTTSESESGSWLGVVQAGWSPLALAIDLDQAAVVYHPVHRREVMALVKNMFFYWLNGWLLVARNDGHS